MKLLRSFNKSERLLWGFSVFLILSAFFAFDRANYLNLFASFIGVTSIIINAKGNPLGQGLMIIFSLLYGAISYSFSYYGEMITYMGMTMPMAAFSLISWLLHPYKGSHSQVEVGRVGKKEYILMLALTLLVTAGFYFILKALGTASLLFSTLSVATSFAAAYLTFRRSRFFSLAYALNDIVLIILWGIAAFSDRTYISVIICFIMFFANDIYGFISWGKLEKRQKETGHDNDE